MKLRIREFRGTFTIEKEIERIRYKWNWKRFRDDKTTVNVYTPVDYYGNVVLEYRDIPISSPMTFTNIKEAKENLSRLMKPEKFYYVKYDNGVEKHNEVH